MKNELAEHFREVLTIINETHNDREYEQAFDCFTTILNSVKEVEEES